MVLSYFCLLPLRHVKDIGDYSVPVLLHGGVGTVPYGNATHGTLQDWVCRTGDSRENNSGSDGKGGTG